MEIISFLFGNPQDDYAAQAQAAEDQRQQRITTGTGEIDRAFSGFTPAFYDERNRAYTNYALPQLSEQYQQARNTLITNLANRGLLNTSMQGRQMSALQRQTEQGRQTIAEAGRAQAQDLQRQVEGSRGQLIGQLYQSADPANARQQAISTASSFQQPSVFAPLANMFSGLVDTYYRNALQQQANQPVVGGRVPSFYDVNSSASPSPYSSRRVP